jgi:hypothetical protein
MNKRPNYVGTPRHTYPTPVSHNNILNKKKYVQRVGGARPYPRTKVEVLKHQSKR